MNWYEILNNREWAIIIWFFLLISWFISSKVLRHALFNSVKAFFARSIIIMISLMLTYIVIVVAELSHFGLWDSSQLKNTIIWGLTIAIPTLFDLKRMRSEKEYFKETLVDIVKLSIFLEYLIGLYVFSLPVELFFIPLSVIVGTLLIFAKSNIKYKNAEILFYSISIILGLFLIGNSLYNAYLNASSLISFATFIDFSSPIILSILFLPFVYVVFIYSNYERLYLSLPIYIRDASLRKYIKLQSLLACRLDCNMLDRFLGDLIRQRPNNKQEVLALLRKDKFGQTEKPVS